MNARHIQVITGTVGVAMLLGSTAAFAQSSSSTSSTAISDPATCSAALLAQTQDELAVMDDMHAARKTALQERTNALTAALAITDETARNEALKTAMETSRTAEMEKMKTMMESSKDKHETVRAACGDLFPGHMMKMKADGPGMKERFMHMKGIRKGDIPMDATNERSSATTEQ